MDYRIFNVRTDVNACSCTRGCTDAVRESALRVDSGIKKKLKIKNPLRYRGIEPASATCRSDALQPELYPHLAVLISQPSTSYRSVSASSAYLMVEWKVEYSRGGGRNL